MGFSTPRSRVIYFSAVAHVFPAIYKDYITYITPLITIASGPTSRTRWTTWLPSHGVQEACYPGDHTPTSDGQSCRSGVGAIRRSGTGAWLLLKNTCLARVMYCWWHEILHQLNTRMVNDGSWYDTCYICYMIFRLLHLSHHISTGKQDLFQGFFPSNPGGLDSFRSVEATKNWWPKVAPTATFLLLRVRWAEVGVTKLTTATRTTTTTTTRGYKRRN